MSPAAPSTAERIRAARGAKREYRDIDVVLAEDVAEQIDALEKQIEEHQAEIAEHEEEKVRLEPELRFSDPRPAQIDEQIAAARETLTGLEQQRDELRTGSLLRLRFEKMDGETWAEIMTHNPPRVNSTIDQLSGYNYHTTAKEAAPLCGYVLGEDDAREDLDRDAWASLFEVMSGRELETFATALWEMNDWGPRRRIEAARKASADGSGSRSS